MSDNEKIWLARKDALDRALDETIVWAEGVLAAPMVRGEGFENAQLRAALNGLRALRHFSHAAFEFFYYGFYFGYLQRSKAYHSGYVFRTLLEQMSVDLNLLQKAIFQRRRASDGKMTEQAQTLALADRLASAALKPAREAGFVRDSAVVTHLARDFDIRLVPYYDLLLIGVPYATHNLNGAPTLDFLGIPHEVGHFVFERGRAPGQNGYVEHVVLERTRLETSDWRYQRLEELFADAYGCLIAGPVNVLGLQDFLQDEPRRTLTQDTGEHPLPVLRPLVQTQMLRAMTDEEGQPRFPHAPDHLDATWQAWVGEDDLLAQEYKLQGVGDRMTGQEILQGLVEVAEEILNTLAALTPHSAPALWTGDLAQGRRLSELVRQFATREYPVEDERAGRQEVPERAYDRFRARLAEIDRATVSVDELIRFVLFEDWSTELIEGLAPMGFIDRPASEDELISADGFIDRPA